MSATADDFPGDELHDLWLNDNREVEVGGDGDLVLTSGAVTVEQSVGIEAGRVLRPLIGEPLDGETYADIESELAEILDADPQLDGVERVSIDEVNRASGEVTITAHVSYDESFQLTAVIP